MAENPETSHPKYVESATTQFARWTVLLVESDPAETTRFQEWIAQYGEGRFELQYADSLRAALTRLSLGRVHLVLLNLELSDSQGVPTFTRLKAFFPEVPVIALSPRENEDWARETTRQGAQSFLVKRQLNAYWLRRAMINTLERHAAEEKLRAAKALYHSLVEQLPHGIFRKDLQGRYTFANLRFCQMTGANPEQVIGQTTAALLPPELAARFRAQDDEVLRTGSAYEATEEFVFPDGRGGYVHVIKTPILDRRGRVCGLQGLLMDVTERQQAEAQLRSSQRLLQAIVDNTTLVIYVKDAAGRYLLVNAPFEQLFGVPRRAALGRTDYQVFAREVADALWPHDHRVLAERRPQEFQEFITSGGVTRTFAALKFPLVDDAGEPYAVCSIATDVTEKERAQRALQESQERLALVIQGSNDGIWDWDLATNRVYFSARWKSMLGYAEEEVEDTFAAWERLLHPDDLARARQTLRNYLEGRAPVYELEHRLRHKDGSYRWILARGVALRDSDGRPLRMAGSHVDLTERKRLEQRLQAKYNITQALAESVSLREATPRILQAVCECLDWDYGEFWWLDAAAQRLRCRGLWHKESVELRQLGLASQILDFPRGVCLPGQVWAEGHPLWIPDATQPGGVRRFEWFQGLMAGVWLPEARHESEGPRVAQVRAAGLHGALGVPVQFGQELLGVMDFFSREIRPPDEALLQLFAAVGSQFGQFIARTRAEEARGRLAALVESSEDAIFSEDLEGRITSWNAGAARMFGYTPEEILGRPAACLAPREKAREVEQVRQRLLRGEPLGHLETVRQTKNGKAIYVSLTLSVLKNPSGQPEGLSTIARDVTERRRAERRLRATALRLEQSNRDLLDFAFVASHDLQEPLGKVKAFAELLQQEATTGLTDKGRDYLARLLKSTTRMQDLIDGLLSYSRVHTQAQPFAEVPLDGVLREVLGDLDALIQSTGARIEAEPLGVIEADPTQMRQLLQNLLSNALKFTRPGVPPVVRLQAERVLESSGSTTVGPPAQVCRLSIQDNGIGIEPQHQARLFKMFERLHPPQQYPGSGIGLAICRRIAQRHHGSITVQSQPEQGATFIVTLPVKQAKGDTAT